jgi:DNA-binding transcriptional LysR family regulator
MLADLWSGLEVRHLAALRAVADEGTFAAAAARLGYTQSAISQQIAALEKIAGQSLLRRTRGRKPLGLTDAGTLVLRHGEAILARANALQADLASLEQGAAGPVRVGTYPSVGLRILPALLPAFAREAPAVEVQLHESNSDGELLALIEAGALDLAFCMLPLKEGPFGALELLRDPWLLIAPAGSAAPGNGAGSDVPFGASQALLSFRTCPAIEEIESLLQRWGVQHTTVFRSDDNATLQSLVGAGLGIAFMPRLTIDLSDPRTVVLDVRSELTPRRIALAWHRDRHQGAALHTFVKAARAVARQLQDEIDTLPPDRQAPISRRLPS